MGQRLKAKTPCRHSMHSLMSQKGNEIPDERVINTQIVNKGYMGTIKNHHSEKMHIPKGQDVPGIYMLIQVKGKLGKGQDNAPRLTLVMTQPKNHYQMTIQNDPH